MELFHYFFKEIGKNNLKKKILFIFGISVLNRFLKHCKNNSRISYDFNIHSQYYVAHLFYSDLYPLY